MPARAWLVTWFLFAGCAPPSGGDLPLDPRLRSDEAYGTLASPSRGTFGATGFNAFIMAAAQGFGQADYLWQGDGVTREIYYQSTLIAAPYAADKCHCVGATFQVYMTAFEAWDKQYAGSSGSLRGLTPAQVKELKKIWFVATSDESGAQGALVGLGLGTKVTSLAQARQGDPVQIWRNNGSGHSVIFDSWKMDGGQITGITYFSCNSGGPGFATETVGSGTKDVTLSRIYVGHPLPPSDLPDLGPPPVPDGSILADATPVREAAPAGDLPSAAADGQQQERPEEGCGCRVAAAPAATGWLMFLTWLGLVLHRLRGR